MLFFRLFGAYKWHTFAMLGFLGSCDVGVFAASLHYIHTIPRP